MVLRSRLLNSSAVATALSLAVAGQAAAPDFLTFVAEPSTCTIAAKSPYPPQMPPCDSGNHMHEIAVMPVSGATTGTATYSSGTIFVSALSGAVPDAILDGRQYPTRPAMSPRPDRRQFARDKARWSKFC